MPSSLWGDSDVLIMIQESVEVKGETQLIRCSTSQDFAKSHSYRESVPEGVLATTQSNRMLLSHADSVAGVTTVAVA